jgi:hypothetical protein
MKQNGGYQPPTYNQSYQRFSPNQGYQPEPLNGYLTQQVPVQLSFFKGRPVVSVEEARAAQIDFDGSLNIFTDLGKSKIYTKQFNPDGTVTFNTFVLSQEKEAEPIEYVTKEEFNTALSGMQTALAELTKAASITQQPPKKIEF